jgi:glycosyltransferase involved in cell wall biosynthesis
MHENAFLSDNKTMKLSIVVPVFNEAHRLTENLDILIDEVESAFHNYEIIVVSDGSTDETNLKLHSFKHPGVRPIILVQNMGKGSAVRAGFEQASGDYVLFIDGGMEIHPKEIRIFMGLMQLYQADIVIGSKRHPQSRVEYPWYRRILSWVFQRLIHALFDVEVTDTQVGIKLFRREVIDAILPHLEIDRYGFDLELLMLAKVFGFANVMEAPIRLDYFNTNTKSAPADMLRVVRVGFHLLADTLKLYARKRLLARARLENISNERKAG